jgi:hypothetical protein
MRPRELLIRHGGILPRDDFARYVHTGTGTSTSDGPPRWPSYRVSVC